MTITLFWWYIPIAFFIAGWIAFAKAEAFDIFNVFLGFICWGLALGICVGHWI